MNHADGGWRTVEAVSTNLVHDPSIAGLVVSARDVTDRRYAEAELREAQERFRSAFEHAPIGMALMSLDGELFRVNHAMVQILGRSTEELLRTTVGDLTHPDDHEACAEALGHLLSGQAPSWQLDLRFIHHSGHLVWVALSWSLVRDLEGNALYFVCQMEDITERKASGEALAHQAIHDPLTGLPNRTLFVERLDRDLARSASLPNRMAVLFLDLDRFKVVNDSLGHSAGDRLLVAVADRLSSAMRPDDVVARFGGDEFTVLCQNVTSVDAVEQIAQRIAEVIAKPVPLVEGEVFVTVSIGIAMADGHGDTPETLLRNADAAMYSAKENGRDRAEVFDIPTHHRAVDDLRTGSALHRAIERGELRMHYQPVLDIARGALTGFEALIRWQHPERGLVPPSEFIPLAEETGLIVPLGAWALEESCHQAKVWHDAACDGTRLSMSVNLSLRQLAEPSFPTEVARVLGQTGLSADSLWLEITETTLMRDVESALSAAQRVAHARSAPRGRRLRHRLLVDGVPGAAAGRVAQDRPVVRRGRRSTLRQQRDRHRDREPGARAPAQDGRRRDRAARTAPLVDRDRLRVRAGLSLRARAPGRVLRSRSDPVDDRAATPDREGRLISPGGRDPTGSSALRATG